MSGSENMGQLNCLPLRVFHFLFAPSILPTPPAEDKRSYASYRAALAALPPGAPLIPHLGAHTAEMTMADQQLPAELPAPGAAAATAAVAKGGKQAQQIAATHIHFRRYRELFRLHCTMVDFQRRAYPAEELGPYVTSVVDLLGSQQRAFHFFSDERREEAVAALDVRSQQLEPPPETLEASATAVGGRGKKRR